MQKLKERRDQINVNQNRDHSADLELLRAEMEALQEEKLQAEEVMTEARHALEQADTRLRQLEQERSEAEQQALAACLQITMSAEKATRKQAEDQLEQFKKKPECAIISLQMLMPEFAH